MQRSAFLPKMPGLPNIIDGNAIIKNLKQQNIDQPKNYGRIKNLNTGQVVEKIGSKPITSSQPNQSKSKQVSPDLGSRLSPLDSVFALAKQYNDFIAANDLNDSRINLDDYFNQDSPNYLDQTDPQGIDAEGQYIQNQLYRLKGDKRYVPDYEDVMSMPDEEFVKYEQNYLR